MLRLIQPQAVLSGSTSAIANEAVAPATGGAASPTAGPAERAQQDVTALYEERGEEFLHYALALARDEELAKDALQESFMRYFVALCAGEEIASPRAWLYCVLHNYLLDRIKDARRHNAKRIHEPLSCTRQQDIEGECLRNEFLDQIRTALTPREYDCLRLRTEGLRYKEIATSLHLASGTVGALLYRAMRKVQNLLNPRKDQA